MTENHESYENIIEEDRLYEVEEMAAYLGVRPGALKDWTKLEENPCPCFRKDTRILRFDKAEVRAWFRARTEEWTKKRAAKAAKEEPQNTIDLNTKFEIID